MTEEKKEQPKVDASVIQELKAMKELSKQLPGKSVILGPKAAFFMDNDKQYILTAYGNLNDKQAENHTTKVEIQKDWKLHSTMMGIKHGLLRVVDTDGKDISSQFGGPVLETHKTPLVDVGISMMDKDNTRDKKLAEILNNPVEDKVLIEIAQRNPSYETLERLLQLEVAGENPSFSGRGKVVDGIRELMKKAILPGELVARKLDDKEEKVVTATRT